MTATKDLNGQCKMPLKTWLMTVFFTGLCFTLRYSINATAKPKPAFDSSSGSSSPHVAGS